MSNCLLDIDEHTDLLHNINITLPPVLPSDSIIYTTDTSQIYASSRRKSRQLQTSFDYDPISGK